ncbi:hypothetical protein ACLOJK_016235 [Asimina triloba]
MPSKSLPSKGVRRARGKRIEFEGRYVTQGHLQLAVGQERRSVLHREPFLPQIKQKQCTEKAECKCSLKLNQHTRRNVLVNGRREKKPSRMKVVATNTPPGLKVEAGKYSFHHSSIKTQK